MSFKDLADKIDASKAEDDAAWERRYAKLGLKRPTAEEIRARFEAWKAKQA